MADSEINYDKAIEYWSSVSADDDGVLGGFGNTIVPKVDIVGSQAFLRRLTALSPKTFPKVKSEPISCALDVGAGVGRVTKDLLCKYVDNVDLVEPALPLIQAAKKNLESISQARGYFACGLQDFEFSQSYDLVWCQWCLGQVPDQELVKFLVRVQQNLTPGGIIVVKENQSSQPVDIYDETDSSVTRTDEKFRQIFKAAGLRLLLTALNKGMPKELFPVRMYALAAPIGGPIPSAAAPTAEADDAMIE